MCGGSELQVVSFAPRHLRCDWTLSLRCRCALLIGCSCVSSSLLLRQQPLSPLFFLSTQKTLNWQNPHSREMTPLWKLFSNETFILVYYFLYTFSCNYRLMLMDQDVIFAFKWNYHKEWQFFLHKLTQEHNRLCLYVCLYVYNFHIILCQAPQEHLWAS